VQNENKVTKTILVKYHASRDAVSFTAFEVMYQALTYNSH